MIGQQRHVLAGKRAGTPHSPATQHQPPAAGQQRRTCGGFMCLRARKRPGWEGCRARYTRPNVPCIGEPKGRAG